MDPGVIAAAVALPIAFAAGVVVHKYVISEAQSIKQHITDEVAELRADVASLLTKAAAKV
jgi:hypothetical protein